MQDIQANATHIVTLGGETAFCTPETFQSVCDALVKKHGGVPKVEAIADAAKEQPRKAPSLPPVLAPAPAKPAPAQHDVDANGVSASGKARAQADEQLALDNGFAPRDPVFAIGTRVVQMGVDNAIRSQLEHDAKPSAKEVCRELVNRVKAEHRVDIPGVDVSELRMNRAGLIKMPECLGGTKFPLAPKAFNSLMGRFPCRSGQAYLESCPTLLRSINFNHWAVELGRLQGTGETKDRLATLRTRQVGGVPVVFAAVSDKYAAFDCDLIGEALYQAFPEEAKGVLDYDGERMRLEGMWHTDVKPEEFVAGEIFKAGVIVRSDDTGGGSVRVQSVVWRNLCRNLYILDKSIGVDIRLRHSGSVERLAKSFREAFAQALKSVDGFAGAWTAARREQGEALKQSVQGTTREDLGLLPIEAVLPGIFTGILKRDLVPVRGRAKDLVPKLLEMHTQDEAAKEYGVSRASIVNAFTRYAHRVETDPFQADLIREGASALLSGHKGRAPAPLPYVTPEL